MEDCICNQKKIGSQVPAAVATTKMTKREGAVQTKVSRGELRANQEGEGGGFYTHLNQELMTFSFVEIQRSVQHNDAGCRTDSKLCLGAHRFIVAE
jgi:hypothetical protein